MVDLNIFEFPLSLILASVPVLCILICNNGKLKKLLMSGTAAAVLMAVVTLFLVVEGIWGFGLFHHWAFVAAVLLALLSLGFAALSDIEKKSPCALMSHLGLFFVLTGGLFGAPDRTEVMMQLFINGPEGHIALDAEGNTVPLPFNVALQDFTIDYYEDGSSPKQYTSSLEIDGKALQTSVNHPCRYKGYHIYQSSFDTEGGSYSVLKIVRDPWLPLIALGALLLAVAAVLSLGTVWKSWKVLLAALALAAVFAVLSVARIKFGTLVPALRNLWFVPHLIIYMLAYSVMALSVVAGVVSLFSARIPGQLSAKLLSTASSLLLIGMLCGAVWAQQAWGNYWTWDAKECWAAVTWLLTLCATHIHGKNRKLIFTILAFLAMQITWYGVNYLPAAHNSLHTYNQESSL